MPSTCNKSASSTRKKGGYQHKTRPSSIDNDIDNDIDNYNETVKDTLMDKTVEMETNKEEQVQRSIQQNNNSNNNNTNITNCTDDLEIPTEMSITNVNQQQTFDLNQTNQTPALGISNSYQ